MQDEPINKVIFMDEVSLFGILSNQNDKAHVDLKEWFNLPRAYAAYVAILFNHVV